MTTAGMSGMVLSVGSGVVSIAPIMAAGSRTPSVHVMIVVAVWSRGVGDSCGVSG